MLLLALINGHLGRRCPVEEKTSPSFIHRDSKDDNNNKDNNLIVALPRSPKLSSRVRVMNDEGVCLADRKEISLK